MLPLIDARTLGLGVMLVALALSRFAAPAGKPAESDGATPGSATSVAPASSAAVPVATTDHCIERFLSPLRMFSGLDGVRSPPSQRAWTETLADAAAALRNGLGANAAIESMIATVPDPIDSGLGYQYDTSLQALRMGIEQAGRLLPDQTSYFRDRGWLPWDDRDVAPDERAESEGCRKTMPGLILFRSTRPDAPRVLALLLVGETPTSGLRVPAMVNALRAAYALSTRGAQTRSEVSMGAVAISIVGPTFSGSAYSLRLALQVWARHYTESPVRFRIVTGTATGGDLPALLGAGGWLGESHGTFFRATTVPEANLTCRYLNLLNRRLGAARVSENPKERSPGDPPEPLRGVAMLHETGTEFGAAGARSRDDPEQRRCSFAPELDLEFPVHISALRDAYESIDQRGPDPPRIARATALDVSLRENRTPLDVEATPSPKTTHAQDVAIRNLLSQISHRQINHLGIHATDIGDAIFLARKIRDVAPDVRLAFFESDSLLMHPSFRRLLLGSLIITPYPFLGTDDLAESSADHWLRAFAGSLPQGMFNATLAARGVPASALLQYTLPTSPALLPIWVATVARTGIVPITAGPTLDCALAIYGHDARSSEEQELCAESTVDRRGAWRRFAESVRAAPLRIDAAVSLPRFWYFVYALALLMLICDWLFQRKASSSLSMRAVPDSVVRDNDHAADLAIGRTKWLLYSAIRQLVFSFGFFYMGALYLLSLGARKNPWGFASTLLAALTVLALAVATTLTVCACGRFLRDYNALTQSVKDSLRAAANAALGKNLPLAGMPDLPQPEASEPPARLTEVELRRSGFSVSSAAPRQRSELFGRLSGSLGLNAPVDRLKAATASRGQLRTIAIFAVLVAFLALICLAGDLIDSTDWDDGISEVATAWTLLVLRTVPILSGVSPAAPVLLCLGTVYVWCVGRMARLLLAHRLSRVSPVDQEADLVSTPIRVVLYPCHQEGAPNDAGFTRIERDLLNAIWRPITGPYYTFVVATLMAVPLVLFWLKPPSTLEGAWGTGLLALGLSLCIFLIGMTAVQLVMYWLALEKLLKRVIEHRLGPAFASVPPFVRDSLNDQLSRSPHDLLRWAGCLRDFSDLVSAGTSLGPAFAHEIRQSMEAQHSCLQNLRSAAMIKANEEDARLAARSESLLGQGIVQAAADVTALLELAWTARIDVLRARALAQPFASPAANASQDDTAKTTGARDENGAAKSDDARSDGLTAVASHFSSVELAWLRKAQRFVATVVTILVNLHMRQFRHFLFTLSMSSLLLLATVTSYAFEPYRLLLSVAWVVIVSVMTIGIWIFIELDRNTLISHISGSVPGKLTLNGGMAIRILSWSFVPLLGIAATQYPEVANLLYAIVNPFLSALK